MPGFCMPKFSVHAFHYIPGNNFVFVRLILVFGNPEFPPSRGFLSNINNFALPLSLTIAYIIFTFPMLGRILYS